MRFLRGACVGILGWMFYQFFGMLYASGGYTPYGDLMLLGLALTFIGPIYYWIIEPLRGGGKPEIFSIWRCHKCNQPILMGTAFCSNCGIKIKEEK